MSCARCRKALVAEPTCESFDEHVTLRVTTWRCGTCHDVIEELVSEAMGEGRVPRRTQYVVREWTTPQRPSRVRVRPSVRMLRDAAA